MEIQVGDVIKLKNKPERLFGALKVLEIKSDYAVCTYYLLYKDLIGYERPTALIPTKSSFPLKDLTLCTTN